ncbi:MAG: divergent polysaccharide deacetylase family protein [Acetobacteraceae bacterium]
MLPRQIFAGWRGLGVFWLIVVALLLAGGIALQLAGPPAPRAPPLPAVAQAPAAAGHAPPAASPAAPSTGAAKPAPRETGPAQAQVQAGPRPGRDTPGPIVDPEPALLEPLPGAPADLVPRIAADDRMPMQVYAAGFDTSTRRPRVGLLLAGIGLNQSDSETAIRGLPGGVSLAVSPYAQNVAKLLAAARSGEHEYLLSLPMEPTGFPLNDPGRQAMMTSLTPEQNRPRLMWALSRITGYVGVTGIEAGMRGERFASMPDEMNPVLAEVARRGLLYVDPRPGSEALPLAWNRSVDVVIDEPATGPDIDEKLARLSALAREKGSALGLVGTVRPVTTQRLIAWTSGLAADGLALAPVSALVRAPAKP